MRSRASYLKELEKVVAATQHVVNDLTRENYELRELLKEATQQNDYGRTPGNTQDT